MEIKWKLVDFIFLGSKITADGDVSHEIKRHLLLGRKAMTKLDSMLKIRDITLPTKVHLVKAGEGNGTPLQCSCLENPRDSRTWWAAVYGVAKSWTRLKRLSSSSSQGYGFSSSHEWMWELDHKESWASKNWCFCTVVLEKILKSPSESKEIKTVYPKGNLEGLMLKLKLQYFGHLMQKHDSLEKPLMLGKI